MSFFSLGAEKKLMEDVSLSLRLVQKHLIRTIEDIGVYVWDGETLEQQFYVANPGFGVTRPVSEGGLFSDDFWPCPKATREYWGVNVSLEKKFSDNWQGGVNYTWSRVTGCWTGLASSDEDGRIGPNVEQDYDQWFMGYDARGHVLDGPLPQDRTHYLKAYGSYSFPFGLTVGLTAYGRSGLPLTTKLFYGQKFFYPNGRGDMGRLPFTLWANLYLDYSFKIGAKYRASVNFQVDNVTDTKTIQSRIMDYNLDGFSGYDAEILSGDFARNYRTYTADEDDLHPAFGWWSTRFAPWTARLGFKLSF